MRLTSQLASPLRELGEVAERTVLFAVLRDGISKPLLTAGNTQVVFPEKPKGAHEHAKISSGVSVEGVWAAGSACASLAVPILVGNAAVADTKLSVAIG